MDTQDRLNRFTPTQDRLDRMIGQSKELACEQGWPLYMLDHLGHPFLIDLGGGRDYELHPWTEVIDTLLVDDNKGRIHWMHPDVRARLDDLTFDAILHELPERLEGGGSPEDAAKEMHEDCRQRLAAYDARRAHIQPAVDLFESDKFFPDVDAALDAIEALTKQLEVDEQVIWRLAQVLRKVPVVFEGSCHDGASVFTASVLSQLIDPRTCIKPGADEAYEARLTVEAHRHTGSCPDAVSMVARAIAHDVLPLDPQAIRDSSEFTVDLLAQEISLGTHDPSPGHDVRSSSMASRIGSLICGYWPSEGTPISAHETIKLVGVANARLDALGIEERLCPQMARERAEADQEIPF